VPLAEFHDDVEEVHRIELQLVAKGGRRASDCSDPHPADVGDDFSDQLSCHSSFVMWRDAVSAPVAEDDEHRVNSEHTKRVVQNCVNPFLPSAAG